MYICRFITCSVFRIIITQYAYDIRGPLMHSFGRHKIKHKVTKFKMGSRDLAACDLQASHYSRTVNGAQTNRYQSSVCSGGSRTGDLGGHLRDAGPSITGNVWFRNITRAHWCINFVQGPLGGRLWREDIDPRDSHMQPALSVCLSVAISRERLKLEPSKKNEKRQLIVRGTNGNCTVCNHITITFTRWRDHLGWVLTTHHGAIYLFV